jgi:hypothetical protein
MSTQTTPETELQSLARDILEWADCNDMSKAELIRQHPALGSDKTLTSIATGKLAELQNASVARWKDFQAALSDAVARLRSGPDSAVPG